MNDNEIVIAGGPRTDWIEVLVRALDEEGIGAKIVLIEDVESANRTAWVSTPGDEVYVVVPLAQRSEALELTRWVSRVCLNCETTLMPRVRACQKCGTPHLMLPGPHIREGLESLLINAETGQVPNRTDLSKPL